MLQGFHTILQNFARNFSFRALGMASSERFHKVCEITASPNARLVTISSVRGCSKPLPQSWSRFPPHPSKIFREIGFTMIQTVNQIHVKLSASLSQQSHPHEPSPLTPASDQNTHTHTIRCHYNASCPWSKHVSGRPRQMKAVLGAAIKMMSLGAS